MATSRYPDRRRLSATDDLCPELRPAQRRKCAKCRTPMVVARPRNESDVVWLCPLAHCHQAIPIDQDQYWAHITKRNEQGVASTYDGPLESYDARLRGQPLGAGPAFVKGYSSKRPSVKLPKQNEFD